MQENLRVIEDNRIAEDNKPRVCTWFNMEKFCFMMEKVKHRCNEHASSHYKTFNYEKQII